MKKLYKYTRSDWASTSLNLGAFWLGTLQDYRKTEIHQGSIGDDSEGLLTIEDRVDQMVVHDPDNDIQLGRFFDIGAGSTVELTNVNLVRNEHFNHFLIYSMARERLAPEVVRNMNANYDSCLELADPFNIFQQLSLSISTRNRFLGLFDCIYEECHITRYVNSVEGFNDSPGLEHPPFVYKHPDYTEQQEVRAVWLIHDTDIRPHGILCPKVINNIRLIEI